MQHTWNIPLDLMNDYLPVITIVIKKFKPISYAVSLKIIDGSEISEVVIWENIHASDHMDQFYRQQKAKKRCKSSMGKISNLNDISKLCHYIDKNHKRFILKYFKG